MPEAIEPSSSGERVLFTKRAIVGATFVGGPLAATYLIAGNFRTLGNDQYTRRTLIIGGLATLLAVPLLFSLPDRFLSHPAGKLLHFLWLIPAHLIVERFQQGQIEAHRAAGGRTASAWKAAGIAFASVVVLVAYSFLYVLLTLPPVIELPQLDAAVQMDYSRCTVYYDPAATSRADAKVVGAIMEKAGCFRTADSTSDALFYKDRDYYTIAFGVEVEHFGDPKIDRVLREALKDLQRAYNGRRYRFRLLATDSVEIMEERFIEFK